jgi:hypothetical protein
MRTRLALVVGTIAALGAVPRARAADHRDGPMALADPTTDITDVYAWMSSDGTKANLVMDIQGANTGAVATTRFSNAALYVFHLNSSMRYGMPPGGQATIICQFDNMPTQGLQCWGPGGEYVADATGDKAGKTSMSGKMQVFAGLRDDPFFFNIRGFNAATAAVKAAAGALAFDTAGCPMVPAAVSQQLVGVLKSDGNGGAPADDFGKSGASAGNGTTTNGNVLSIVVAIDRTLITSGGPIVGVWGSTNKVGP